MADQAKEIHELTQMLEIYVKAGRRCAYDLKHAADSISRAAPESEIYHNRADMWLTIFNPGRDPKNYRNEFHREILRLETNIGRLQRIIVEAGLELPPEF